MNQQSNETDLQVARLMAHRQMSTMELSHLTGAAYNTILSYRRGSSDRLSRRVLEDIAHALRVQVWELFYPGVLAVPLVKIAQALGVQVVSEPVTLDEYKGLIMAISAKCSAGVTEADFAPQTVMVEVE